MSAIVTKLPTSATSYITVRKAGRFWDVVLATPNGSSCLRTALYRLGDRGAAIAQARETAAKMYRPFKGRAGA